MRGTETAHIRGLPIRAYIQAFGDAYKSARMAAHFLITNNIVKLFDWLPVENSCKIRHYEKDFPFFRIPNVFRNDMYK